MAAGALAGCDGDSPGSRTACPTARLRPASRPTASRPTASLPATRRRRPRSRRCRRAPRQLRRPTASVDASAPRSVAPRGCSSCWHSVSRLQRAAQGSLARWGAAGGSDASAPVHGRRIVRRARRRARHDRREGSRDTRPALRSPPGRSASADRGRARAIPERAFATPKSEIFTNPSHDTSTLCGEMSRCTRPRTPTEGNDSSCACSRPRRISTAR